MVRRVKVRSEDGLVVNVVEWDDATDAFPPNEIGFSWHEDDGVVGPGYRLINGTFAAPAAIEPPTPSSSPVLYAAANLKIQDYDITGIDVQSRFAGAFWIDAGKYCVFFAEPQPDTAYMAMASAGPCAAYVLDDEKSEDMFTITVTNAAGDATDASSVNVSILRAS